MNQKILVYRDASLNKHEGATQQVILNGLELLKPQSIADLGGRWLHTTLDMAS